jgi:hypothetical protein
MAIFEYIESFHNAWRRHSAMGVACPTNTNAAGASACLRPVLQEPREPVSAKLRSLHLSPDELPKGLL